MSTQYFYRSILRQPCLTRGVADPVADRHNAFHVKDGTQQGRSDSSRSVPLAGRP
jgi:hypothetical protein